MIYKNEAFINLKLAISPDTTFENCTFNNCILVVFDDSVKTSDCQFINTQVIIAQLLP